MVCWTNNIAKNNFYNQLNMVWTTRPNCREVTISLPGGETLYRTKQGCTYEAMVINSLETFTFMGMHDYVKSSNVQMRWFAPKNGDWNEGRLSGVCADCG